MTVALILNGDLPSESDFKQIEKYESIYCTDGAYNALQKRNITTHAVIGDFDSLKETDRESDQFIYRPDQNSTDFEKALVYLNELDIREIDVYGASGAEQDHFLGNLYVARKWKLRFRLIFFDKHQRYFLGRENEVISDVLGKTISLMPFYQTAKITTKGLQFPLDQADLSFDGSIGIRNKAIASLIKIDHQTGDLIIFIER